MPTSPAWRLAGRLGVTVLALSAAAVPSGQTRLSDALEAFTKGDFSRIESLSWRDRSQVDDASGLLRLRPDDATPAVAAFALEAARGIAIAGETDQRTVDRVFDLLELACKLLKQERAPGRGTARRFAVASVAAFGARGVPRGGAMRNHLQHIAHVLTGSELALIDAIDYEWRARSALDITAPALGVAVIDLPGSSVRYRRHAQTTTQLALAALRRASTHDDARHEAMLRLAALAEAAGLFKDALAALDALGEAGGDRWVFQLSPYVRGRALQGLGLSDEARGAFEEAVLRAPSNRSARLALAASLFLSSRPHAFALAGALESSASMGRDPWGDYFEGFGRHWERARDELRLAVIGK